MKMRTEDYRELRAAMTAAVVSSKRTLQDYLDAGESEERYRWDMFSHCHMSDLHSYLDDNHIDTALRSILNGANYNG